MKRIKRFLIVGLCGLMIFSLAACGKKSDKKSDGADGESEEINWEEEVEVTLPSTLAAITLDEYTEEGVKEKVELEGFKSGKLNDDGTVTFVMSKDAQLQYLSMLEQDVRSVTNSLTDGENATGSFRAIEYDDDMKEFSVYVDPEKYISMETLQSLAIHIAAGTYQAVSGVAEKDIEVTVNFINDSTQEVMDTTTYDEMVRD